MFEIKQAVRRAAPLLMALFGPSGSGKTLSAILLASGLDPDGKVVLIDTEAPRASLHADNERVMAALPNGFQVLELDAPYHPKRFVEAIDLCESSGYKVCIVDSSSDSWNGLGGCEDIAEENKGMWNVPKRANKKMADRIKSSGMHVILCLKAQEKTKIIQGEYNPKTKKKEKIFVPLGMQPICEKNTFYPTLIGWRVDAETHISTMTKCSVETLVPLFETPHLLTKEDGVKLREWNETGSALDPVERLLKRAASAVEDGTVAYREFYGALPGGEKKYILEHGHEDNKMDAEKADQARSESTSEGSE